MNKNSFISKLYLIYSKYLKSLGFSYHFDIKKEDGESITRCLLKQCDIYNHLTYGGLRGRVG